MMLKQSIASDMAISQETERLDQYRFSASANCTKKKAKEKLSLIFSSWPSEIFSRDRYSITVTYDDEAQNISDFTEASRGAIEELFDSVGEDENCNLLIETTINKSLECCTLSIYDPTLFGKYLSDEPLILVLTSLSARMSHALTFETFSPIGQGATPSICFRTTNSADNYDKPTEITEEERRTTLELFQENSFNKTIPGTFIPKDFMLTGTTGIEPIDSFFNKSCAVLSATYISNSAELNADSTLTYRVCGYKNISASISLTELSGISDQLYKIADWAYGPGGSSDKIGLSRNVLSLYVNRLEEISQHPEVLSAIHSNYQIYLKGNIESYLDIKSKITDVLVNTTQKTQELVDSLVDSLKNGIFILLTFLLTVVVINGLKDTSTSAIFSSAYIGVVLILSALLTIWVLVACALSIRQFDKTVDTLETVLKLNYQMILQPIEIDFAFQPIRKKNRLYLKRQATQYAILWISIVTVLTLSFYCGHRILTEPANPISKSQSSPAQTSQPTPTPTPTPTSKTTPSQPPHDKSLRLPEPPSPPADPLRRSVIMRALDESPSN
ncbi:hypothetical protein NG726_14805 [Pseudomonas sp. MOB-449]|nr:hypothetical protein [Pseudomonas sp. MOB-449]